ncbi:MAG: hypothetical protein RR945_07600 [Erysipelotrichaceae bacterium]|uniref:hypothetical protein n=1 Tax=Anaerorhabdus sp. TaxID=1872524 RepID=UPI002FC76CE3
MKFTIEQKQDLVSRYYAGESTYDICIKEKIPKSTFYTWIKPHKEVKGYSKIVVTPDKYQKLKQKVEKQSLIIEVLQKVHCTASSQLKERLAELEKLYGQYSTYVFCDALLVTRGTFINHMNKPNMDSIISNVDAKI